MRTVLGIALLATLVACTDDREDQKETLPPADRSWTRLRGPGGSGAGAVGSLAALLEAAPRWTQPVPPGRSSPVIFGERIFLTAHEGGALLTLAFSLDTGAELWRREVPAAHVSAYHEHNSPASPTPAVDAERVVVFFPDFGLVAYTHGGDERWRAPLGPFASKVGYGLAASPILAGGLVVQALDEHGRSDLLALDAATGDERWRTTRPCIGESWSTPTVVGDELVHVGSFVLESFDLATGARRRWTRGTYHEPISGAVIEDGVAYFCGAGVSQGKGIDPTPVRGEDTNGDQRIGLEEIPAFAAAPDRVRGLFALADDGDGLLDADEALALERAFVHYIRATDGRSVCAVRLRGAGDATDSSYVWSVRGRGVPEVTLPVLVGAALWTLADDTGIVTRYDRATGDVLTQARVDELAGWCFASPVTSGGEVLFVTNDGRAVVLDQGLRVLAERDLKHPCHATPALAQGGIVVRTGRTLVRFAR